MTARINRAILRARLFEARHFFLFVGGLIVAYGVGHLAPTPEQASVYFGAVLQCGGLALVGFGLSEIRKAYGLRALTSRVADWLKSLPAIFSPSTIVGGAAIGLGAATLTGNASSATITRAQNTSEERIAALEAAHKELKAEIEARDLAITRRVNALGEQMMSATKALGDADAALAKKVENLAVGDFQLEVVGLAWLFIGVICTSVPVLVARLIL